MIPAEATGSDEQVVQWMTSSEGAGAAEALLKSVKVEGARSKIKALLESLGEDKDSVMKDI
jgi:hypothetical protein